MFRIERTDELQSYLSAADSWNRMAGGVPFREAAWASSWWRHFGDSVEPFLVVARTPDNEIAGILPLYRRALSSGTRSVGVIGDGPPCTDYLSVLARPDQRREVAFEMGRFPRQSVRQLDRRLGNPRNRRRRGG